MNDHKFTIRQLVKNPGLGIVEFAILELRIAIGCLAGFGKRGNRKLEIDNQKCINSVLESRWQVRCFISVSDLEPLLILELRFANSDWVAGWLWQGQSKIGNRQSKMNKLGIGKSLASSLFHFCFRFRTFGFKRRQYAGIFNRKSQI